jgi:hypothetical protein
MAVVGRSTQEHKCLTRTLPTKDAHINRSRATHTQGDIIDSKQQQQSNQTSRRRKENQQQRRGGVPPHTRHRRDARKWGWRACSPAFALPHTRAHAWHVAEPTRAGVGGCHRAWMALQGCGCVWPGETGAGAGEACEGGTGTPCGALADGARWAPEPAVARPLPTTAPHHGSSLFQSSARPPPTVHAGQRALQRQTGEGRARTTQPAAPHLAARATGAARPPLPHPTNPHTVHCRARWHAGTPRCRAHLPPPPRRATAARSRATHSHSRPCRW